jgi:hypothetical protein
MTGMRINYHKSDLMTINVHPSESHLFSQIFCCKIGTLPFKYIVVPLDYAKSKKENIQPIVDKTLKRFGGWRA